MTSMLCEAVRVGRRYRVDLGDIEALATSIADVGLLHPLVVTPKGTLIAGARRLAAVQHLGWTKVPVRVVDLESLVRGEFVENTARKDFTADEAYAIVEALKPIEQAAAKQRQAEGQKSGGRGKKKLGGKKPPSKETRKARTRAAAATGFSAATLAKIGQIKAAAQANPVVYATVADQLKTAGRGQISRVYKEFEQIRRQQELAHAQATLSQAERDDLASVCDLRVCSCQDLFASGIMPDAVITDPPYGEEFLPLFTELALACRQVPLVAVMVGQSYLPETLQRLCEHLSYRWTLAYLLPGGQAVQQFPRKVNTSWKPVLLFGQSDRWFGDVAVSATNDNDKRFHCWGQSESGMMDLVDRLTIPGQLVCDPFLGGGTTAVVARVLGRRFVGCDIDSSVVDIVQGRLAACHSDA